MPLVNGTGNSPSLGRPTPGVVKQDKSSGDSVDTTKSRSDPQRVRMSSGERPIGAAKGKQSDTEALCHPPPPLRSIVVNAIQTVTLISLVPHLCLGWCLGQVRVSKENSPCAICATSTVSGCVECFLDIHIPTLFQRQGASNAGWGNSFVACRQLPSR